MIGFAMAMIMLGLVVMLGISMLAVMTVMAAPMGLMVMNVHMEPTVMTMDHRVDMCSSTINIRFAAIKHRHLQSRRYDSEDKHPAHDDMKRWHSRGHCSHTIRTDSFYRFHRNEG